MKSSDEELRTPEICLAAAASKHGGLALYERSQLPSKKLKKYTADHPIRVLRRHVAEKRARRRLIRRKNTLPLDSRLKYFQEHKKQHSFVARVLGHPNAAFWGKADLEAIKKELAHGQEYSNHNLRIKKANLKAVVLALRKQGFVVEYTSKHKGLVASYYLAKAGVRYRFSDHTLPETQERLSNRESGHFGNWAEEIIIESDTSLESVLAHFY